MKPSLAGKQENKPIPVHVAIIMDGNGRWAKKKGAARIFGHRNAIKAVREAAESCAECGVKYLTLFAFSTENWDRPAHEVEALMMLLVSTVRSELETLNKNQIRLSAIGNLKDLPGICQEELQDAMDKTKSNTGMVLTLALSYSGRWDMLEATRKIGDDIEKGVLKAKDINTDIFENYLSTKGMPAPELLIRTSGEMRISNFMLWQMAYTELFFTEVLWPDFRKKDIQSAIEAFQKRERRFGKTSEQLESQIG